MQFDFDPGLEEFRHEVRAFVTEKLPTDIFERQQSIGSLMSSNDDIRRWLAILNEKGWAVPHWPVDLGGQQWSPQEHFVFEEELYRAYAPEFPWGSTHMVAPTIYTFGTTAQQEQFLPSIRSGAMMWAQGFSEPGAGSDLASLRTTAIRDGDQYTVNGQKIWTSGAHDSDWGFFLVKTDLTVKPQRGVSFLLIDLKTPGITIRRIPQLNNEAHVCEVFLDNVVVPAENLVGEAGKGWSYAKFLLDHERTASSYIYWNKRELRRTKELARSEMRAGSALAEDPLFRVRLARLDAEVTALEWSVLRVLANEKFAYDETASASVLKVRGSELQQAITETQMDLIGEKTIRSYPHGALGSEAGSQWPGHVVGRTNMALLARAATIFGGSKQIQKNIIAKLAFNL